jgi:cytochrome c553
LGTFAKLSGAQIYDMKLGARAGVGSKMMTSVVAESKEEDIVALAAYVASLQP